MSVKPVSVKLNSRANSTQESANQPVNIDNNAKYPAIKDSFAQNNAQNVNFGGVGDGVVMFMDGIERGGFVAGFLAQDAVGMVAPRILEGLYRNSEETGHLNWDFAQREMLRECLSGPSTFVIPLVMMTAIKKYSGTANNVKVDFIKAFGEEFSNYAGGKGVDVSNLKRTQSEYFEQVYKNVLKTSTDNKIPAEELDELAKDFADRTMQINSAKSKGFFKKISGKKVAGSREDLISEMANKFISIRKKYTSPSTPHWVAEIGTGDSKKLSASIASFTSNLLDYANDATENAKSFVNKNKDGNVVDFIKNHKMRRMGSRFATNLGIWLSVVGFSLTIPKIYNMGLQGKNPGMVGLEEPEANVDDKKAENKQDKKNQADKVNFSGRQEVFKNISEKMTKGKNFKKFSDFFEFDGLSMTANSTLALLYGVYMPTRLMGASDKHDTKEIWTRDLLSFTSILFGASAISRGFSKIMSGVSGLALNSTPENHDKSLLHKAKNYLIGGINVFKSDELTARYSNVHEYEGGINGFFDFVTENGGNLKRMLAIDSDIKKHTEKILNKELIHSKNSEIEEAFKNAKGSKELDAIYEILKNPENKLVKRAKLLNSTFGFLSTIVLVPAFMIWLARYCENMTKKDVNDEKFTEIAKRYMHDDFTSADYITVKHLDKKVLEDVKANRIYGYKYDAKNNMIRDLKGHEKQVSDIRVEIKKFVDKATPKGQKRQIIKEAEEPKQNNSNYNLFMVSQNQLKENFLTK